MRYAPKIAEMNDSDPYLFKTSKKIKSVEFKNIYGLAQFSEISGNPLRRLKKHCYIIGFSIKLIRVILMVCYDTC